jgi:hypothetical protein
VHMNSCYSFGERRCYETEFEMKLIIILVYNVCIEKKKCNRDHIHTCIQRKKRKK